MNNITTFNQQAPVYVTYNYFIFNRFEKWINEPNAKVTIANIIFILQITVSGQTFRSKIGSSSVPM